MNFQTEAKEVNTTKSEYIEVYRSHSAIEFTLLAVFKNHKMPFVFRIAHYQLLFREYSKSRCSPVSSTDLSHPEGFGLQALVYEVNVQLSYPLFMYLSVKP